MTQITDVTDEEVRSLTQSVLTRYGIDFTCYEPKSLKRRINRILTNFQFSSIHELWIRLLRDREFIYTFMNEVSVGMTSMFRDPVLWKSLKKRLKSEFGQQETLNVWHAGCSTGEEVYSMGILLQETQLHSRTRALATDINQDAIEIARKGSYHKIRMIENENNYREYNAYSDFAKYYDSVGKDAIMKPGIISHAKFSYHNLISDSVVGEYDIIFCRNVMIYFDATAKSILLDKFYQALRPGGYLIIGFYDTMLPIINQAKLTIADEEAKIFSRVG
jgi:chemotaxis protein methyltransferase CheR